MATPGKKRAADGTYELEGQPDPVKPRLFGVPDLFLKATEEEIYGSNPDAVYKRMLEYWNQGYNPPPSPNCIIETLKGNNRLKWEPVFLGLAAVTYAQGPHVNTVIDRTAVSEYCEALDFFDDAFNDELTAEELEEAGDFALISSERIKHLNEATRIEVPRTAWPVIGQSSRLITPWQIDQHFITLIIDSVSREGKLNAWTLKYHDSALPRPGDPDTVGWASALKLIAPCITEMLREVDWFKKFEVDPHQLIGGLQILPTGWQAGATCGIHTVMNGWAAALGWKLNPDFDAKALKRNEADGSRRYFSLEASRMLNLAMMGRMNAVTIFLFLRSWGYIQSDAKIHHGLSFERTVDVATEADLDLVAYGKFVASISP